MNSNRIALCGSQAFENEDADAAPHQGGEEEFLIPGFDSHEPTTVDVDVDEEAVADEALAAIVERRGTPEIYARGGRLVRVVCDASPSRALLRSAVSPRIVPVTGPNLRELLSRCARFTRDERPISPPEFIVRALLDRGEWTDVPRLRAISDTPVLRADGTITEPSGYDTPTELLISPSCVVPELPHEPTHDDAIRARDILLDVFADFPFECEHHRSGALAGVLTLFARHAFDGPAPLFPIDKNVRGAGGSLLADAIGMIATGRPMPRMISAKDPEEERKKITSIALAGDTLVLVDNVAGVLGTEALDAALTGTVWRDRLLGGNVSVTLPLIATWFASGNNIEFGADTLRRVCPIRLSSPEERPEERSGFRHPELLAWIREQRGRLVAAALTLLRAYFVAGRPDTQLKPWGSYEAWSGIVRATIVWVGLEDPARGREELTSIGDSERNALADLLRAWRRLFGDQGSTIASALRRLEKEGIDPDSIALRSALAEMVPSRPGALPSARAVGAALKKARGRVVAGHAADVRKGNDRNGARWVVRAVRGDSRDSGDSFRSLPTSSDEDLSNPKRAKKQSPESPESPRRRMRKRSEVGQ